MRLRSLLQYRVWFLVAALLLIAPQVHASAPIAKVTQFKGETLIQHDPAVPYELIQMGALAQLTAMSVT